MRDLVFYEYADKDRDETLRLQPLSFTEAEELAQMHEYNIFPVTELTVMSDGEEVTVLLDVSECIVLAERLLRHARKAGRE